MLKKAFTLVELIVVMTLIVILSSIGFFSYLQYTEGTRDTSRVHQLQIIGDGIDLALSKGIKLTPESAIVVNVEGEKYSTQGLAGKEILGKIKYVSDGLDPKTKELFTFSLGANNKEYDMLTALDNPNNSPKKQLINSFVSDSNGRIPYVYGKNTVGIFVDSNYVPLNKILNGTLDIDCDTTNNGYKLIFENGLILDPITWQNQFEYGPCYVEDLTSIIPTPPPSP
ncbi:type II secretion system protein [Candidatus Gracilibacteria bacterium]|nr:type II secretion system protein [Candidatus Gracilibacteria bacterium]